MSKPFGPDTIPVNVIGPWHFGHGGRSISIRPGSAMRDCGMYCAPRIRRERDALSPVVARTEAVMQDQYLEGHPVPRPI